jgi:regulatory protein
METGDKTITAIRTGKNPRLERSNVYLDGKFAFSLNNEVIVKQKLQVGKTLTRQQLNNLNGDDNKLRCLNVAYHFLSLRPRSRKEVEVQLKKHGFETSEIESTLDKLEKLHLLDDQAFADYWQENRTTFRPRSRWALSQELRQKGVENEVIHTALETLDENTNAYRAARQKARTLLTADYLEFRRKLGGFLQRRGFGYGVIQNTVKRVWQENSGRAPVDITDETGEAQD